MAEYLIQDTTLTAIGDAIRAKTGGTELIAPENMPTEIENIQSGSTELADAYYAMTSCLTAIKFQNSTELEWVPQINTSKITDFSQIFSGCINLKRIDSINTSNGTTFQSMFASCTSLTSVPQLDVSKGTKFMHMFYNCTSLTSVPQLDVSNGTNFQNMFNNCTKLVNVSFVENSIKSSISFVNSPLLSDESIQSIIDGLATVETAQTLTLHQDVKAKLTESQIAQITSKNWNLA